MNRLNPKGLPAPRALITEKVKVTITESNLTKTRQKTVEYLYEYGLDEGISIEIHDAVVNELIKTTQNDENAEP